MSNKLSARKRLAILVRCCWKREEYVDKCGKCVGGHTKKGRKDTEARYMSARGRTSSAVVCGVCVLSADRLRGTTEGV